MIPWKAEFLEKQLTTQESLLPYENSGFIVIFAMACQLSQIGIRRIQPTPLPAASYHLQLNLILSDPLRFFQISVLQVFGPLCMYFPYLSHMLLFPLTLSLSPKYCNL
jgi:hypothetical protein